MTTLGTSKAVRRLGTTLLLLWLAAAIFGPALAPFGPFELDLERSLEGPSAQHWLGTDENGADVFTALLYGARVAAIVGLCTVMVSAAFGIALGCISGFFGGWVDETAMRAVDIVMAFPGILLAILILFVTQEPSTMTVVFALCVTGWASYARLVRGQVLTLREREFVVAAQALGEPPVRIMWRHIVPNLLAPVIVQGTFGLASAILAEASLSFLGLGAQDAPSWGALLDQGAHYFLVSHHLATFPGLAIMITVLGINFLGDALRDGYDPRHGERSR